MISIKKVQVVPLDINYGKIIDSFNTTDNKQTNAPSINAVEQYVGTQSYAKTDFATVSFEVTLTTDEQLISSQALNYPTGFNWDNTYVLSCKSVNSTKDSYKSANIVSHYNTSTSTFNYDDAFRISMQENSMYFRGRLPWASGDTVTVIILLMKVD